jgi:hypothetical protein
MHRTNKQKIRSNLKTGIKNIELFCPKHNVRFYFIVSEVRVGKQFTKKCNITRHMEIRVITKLPTSEQSYKGKVKTHNYINRQNQSKTGKL